MYLYSYNGIIERSAAITMDNANLLKDEELLKVSGGYDETQGFSAGFKIKCPCCGASNVGNFDSNSVNTLGQQFYQCKNCGQAFLLDGGGYGTLLNKANNTFQAERY